MERDEFTDVESDTSWWLLERDYYPIQELRMHLGVVLGSSEAEWYRAVTPLEELYRRLENAGPELLTHLDTADTDEQRIAWLSEVLAAVAPGDEDSAADETDAAPVTIEDTIPAPAGSRPAAFAKKSAFAKKNEDSDADLGRVAQAVIEDLGSPADLAVEMGVSEQEMRRILSDLPEDFEALVEAEADKLIGTE